MTGAWGTTTHEEPTGELRFERRETLSKTMTILQQRWRIWTVEGIWVKGNCSTEWRDVPVVKEGEG